MTIIEEKRKNVIDSINNIEDEILLDFISTLTHTNTEIEIFDPIISELIKKAELQIENGEIYTNEEVKELIRQW